MEVRLKGAIDKDGLSDEIGSLEQPSLTVTQMVGTLGKLIMAMLGLRILYPFIGWVIGKIGRASPSGESISGEEFESMLNTNRIVHGIITGLDGLLTESDAIQKPYLSHIAAKDGFVPPEAQTTILQGLGGNPLCSLHVYDEQDHAFARKGGEHYDQAAADLANARTAAFFKTNLS